MPKSLLLLFSLLLGTISFSQTCTLFFSEYIEGASNNKAIEIYNPLGVPVDLADYKVYRYNNGSPTPSDSLQLVGILNAGAVYVAGNPSAVAGILAVSDTLHTITFFNGDDAMELRYMPTSTTLDIIGIIGTDPGTNWPVGSGATSEFTLVRQTVYTDGELNWAVCSNEWDVYPQNTFSFLGSHSGNPCCTATSSSITASACDSYTWVQNNMTYTTSGMYNDTIANAVGCDSIITLDLTINMSTTATVTASACESYTWAQNNVTYTVSGMYNDTIANAVGCDSIITLDLTINMPTTFTVTASACESYTWAQNNMTYTASGMYNDTIANAAGCDSIITLDLTINMPTTFTVTASACESYTWAQNGMTYTASGMYNDTIANAVGCDSIITLDLTINMSTTETVTASACESYTWAQNGMTYTVSGMYNDTIVNAAGCDSIVVLDLTITGLPTATATDNGDATITASAGSTYQWINCLSGPILNATSQTYTATANGDYAVVVTNAGGCSDTSSCVTIDYIGLKEIMDASIRVFPNPTNNDVFVTMGATEATVEVSDAQGKLLQTVVVKNGEKVSLKDTISGVYFLKVQTEKGVTLVRVIKL